MPRLPSLVRPPSAMAPAAGAVVQDGDAAGATGLGRSGSRSNGGSGNGCGQPNTGSNSSSSSSSSLAATTSPATEDAERSELQAYTRLDRSAVPLAGASACVPGCGSAFDSLAASLALLDATASRAGAALSAALDDAIQNRRGLAQAESNGALGSFQEAQPVPCDEAASTIGSRGRSMSRASSSRPACGADAATAPTITHACQDALSSSSTSSSTSSSRQPIASPAATQHAFAGAGMAADAHEARQPGLPQPPSPAAARAHPSSDGACRGARGGAPCRGLASRDPLSAVVRQLNCTASKLRQLQVSASGGLGGGSMSWAPEEAMGATQPVRPLGD
ncbi:hypothetical protein MNEG_2620, partial [Monoraphidium neglectum]